MCENRNQREYRVILKSQKDAFVQDKEENQYRILDEFPLTEEDKFLELNKYWPVDTDENANYAKRD